MLTNYKDEEEDKLQMSMKFYQGDDSKDQPPSGFSWQKVD